jgi:polar amino acid transport system permease protein
MWELFIENFFNVDTMVQYFPLLLKGLGITVMLVLVCIPLGMAVGMLVAVLYTFHFRWLKRLLVFYVDFIRAFPPLVLLILIYYGLPFLGIQLNDFFAAVLALMLNSSGYYGEIFRAGIESIPKGQTEAARSTGLNAVETMAWVILPQAIRNVIPPLTTNTLEVIKATAVASVVALPELLRTAQLAQGFVYNPTPLVMAAAIYLVCLWPLVRLVSRFERELLSPH